MKRIFIKAYLCLGGVQTATVVQKNREIRHQVRLFELDAYCLEYQIEQSHQYVLELLRGREDMLRTVRAPIALN